MKEEDKAAATQPADEQAKSKKVKGRLKSSGQRLLGSRLSMSQLTVGAFAFVFVLFGSVVLLKTYAASSLELPTDANTVVMSYTLPHAAMAQSDTQLASVRYDPFALYGNGLLVCGHNATDPFKPQRSEDDDAMMAGMAMDDAPTTTTLSRDQMVKLANSVKDAGFLNLKPEYYLNPVSGRQSVIRMITEGGEHDVLYYNDVAAPAAYARTLGVLQAQCAKATATYVSDTATVETLADASDPALATTPLDQLTQKVSQPSADALSSAIATSRQLKAQIAATGDTQGNSTVATSSVVGQAAKDLQSSLQGKTKRLVSQAGKTYEVNVLPQPPTVSNPLNIDYAKLRSKTSPVSVLLDKLHITSKAEAAAPIPVRVVLLLPNSGGSTANFNELKTRGQQMASWYCSAVGKCFNYIGASIIRGSQSEAYYNGCHQSSGCGDSLLNTLENVAAKDSGTVFRSDVDTLIVPGWQTNELSHGYCGWGYVGANLGAADYYNSASYCAHGLDGAHETGHTFGLNHVCDGTLMQGCSGHGAANCDIPAAGGRPTCKLNATQASFLRGQIQFFPPPNQLPKGHFDTATCTTMTGWTFDPDSPTSGGANMRYYLYVNGTRRGSFGTYADRPDVNAAYKITGTHGFSINPQTLFSQLSGLTNNTLEVRAIDIQTGGEVSLGARTIPPCPARITAGDVSGDGHADIVAVKPDGTMWYYQNTTNPAAAQMFAAPVQIGTGWSTFDKVMLADVDGDHHADIVGTKTDGSFWYYQYKYTDATHLYAPGVQIGTGWAQFTRVVAGDVDGDGHADLMGMRSDGTLWYYQYKFTDATHLYAPGIQIGTGWTIFTEIDLTDIDGDGHADLIGVKPAGTMSYYRYNPIDATHLYASPIQIGNSGWQGFNKVIAADATADGPAEVFGIKPDGSMLYYFNSIKTNPTGLPYVSGVLQGGGWQIYLPQ